MIKITLSFIITTYSVWGISATLQAPELRKPISCCWRASYFYKLKIDFAELTDDK